MMPEMTGADFYERVAQAFPSVLPRIAFVSGGVFQPEVRVFLDSVPNVCFDKPPDLVALRALIRARVAGRVRWDGVDRRRACSVG